MSFQRCRGRVFVGVVVAVLTVASQASSPAQAVGTPGTWSTVTANASGVFPTLNGIDAVSKNDVWAVGQGADYLSLAQHWDGTSWTIKPTPNVAGSFLTSLRGVSAVSSNDVWAVGDDSGGTPLIVRWNGTSWGRVAFPTLTGYSTLNGVSARAANDVWAVGSTNTNRTLVMHWNGLTWSVVASPNPSTTFIPYNFLYSVHARAANDVWAVGTYSRKGFSPQTLTLRYDGATWRQVATPALKGPTGLDVYSRFDGVSATSTSNVWAVGTVGNQALAMRFNGSVWSVVTTPNESDRQNFLRGVDALAPDDVWAVGASQQVFYFNENQTVYSSSLIEHFDGTTWTIVPSPNPVLNATDIRSVSAVTTRDVWAAGAAGFTAHYA